MYYYVLFSESLTTNKTLSNASLYNNIKRKGQSVVVKKKAARKNLNPSPSPKFLHFLRAHQRKVHQKVLGPVQAPVQATVTVNQTRRRRRKRRKSKRQKKPKLKQRKIRRKRRRKRRRKERKRRRK